jgi:hypothetical protein
MNLLVQGKLTWFYLPPNTRTVEVVDSPQDQRIIELQAAVALSKETSLKAYAASRKGVLAPVYEATTICKKVQAIFKIFLEEVVCLGIRGCHFQRHQTLLQLEKSHLSNDTLQPFLMNPPGPSYAPFHSKAHSFFQVEGQDECTVESVLIKPLDQIQVFAKDSYNTHISLLMLRVSLLALALLITLNLILAPLTTLPSVLMFSLCYGAFGTGALTGGVMAQSFGRVFSGSS